MDLDSLERLSLIVFILGLGAIYASSALFSPDKVVLEDIDEGMVGETVKVNGRVEDVGRSEESVFFRIEAGNSSIRAVSFDDVGVEEGKSYTVEGRVDVYRGELEIVVEEVSRN